MKRLLQSAELPTHSVLVTCSSHEDRCLAFLSRISDWKPKMAVVFHYDDENPKREKNHSLMLAKLEETDIPAREVVFTERRIVKSFRENTKLFHETLLQSDVQNVVLDISVFTKRHLLTLLQWFDDHSFWDHLHVVYSEPEEYIVSTHIPLSFGLSSMRQIPGFPASPNLSRPLHLALFLGYEGDRALAVHEHVQPMTTTMFIGDPPFRPEWRGRSELFNQELIAIVGEDRVRNVDSIDPMKTLDALIQIFDTGSHRSPYSRAISPLGTKPQTLGIYEYLRQTDDAPAVVYASPLRHNHRFSSRGFGPTWTLKGD